MLLMDPGRLASKWTAQKIADFQVPRTQHFELKDLTGLDLLVCCKGPGAGRVWSAEVPDTEPPEQWH